MATASKKQAKREDDVRSSFPALKKLGFISTGKSVPFV